ncbi:MFS transporter [Streptantibioticus parmotrematis]|uniref:MFS transporter n=1 Tax=Streptantibioticus parmotrematis TaxID=2873249 RepID=UPI0033D27591
MHATTPAPTTSAPPDPKRWWALGALVASMLVVGFDATILNVALPTMASQLGADISQQQWIADSYTVVLAALMLPAGLLGDRFGRRRMLVVGLALFLAGSLAGALAGSPAGVIAARTGMGLGAALIMPLAMAVLPAVFGPEERTKAIGMLTAATALGMPLGPIIGGWLLDHFWWGSVFLINVPMVAIGITACVFLLRESSDPSAPRIDTISSALNCVGLGALVYGIIEAPRRGWGDPLVLVMFFGAAALLTALVLRERVAVRPMLDVGLLRQRNFLWNAVAATLVMFVLMGLLFVLPNYLQAVLGADAFGTGVRLLPMMAGLLVTARAAAPLVARFGPRPVIAGGLLVLAAAAFLGSRTTAGDGYGYTALWLSVTGFGFGFAMIPAMDAALGTLPRERAGSGSGLLMTLRQTGGAIGVALLGSVLASAFGARLDTAGLPHAAGAVAGKSVVAAHTVAATLHDPRLAASANAAYVHGMDVVLLLCGVTAVVAAVLVALRLPDSRTAQAPAAAVAPAPADARQ